MTPPAPYDLSPVAGIALVGGLLALLPLAWLWLRHRDAGPSARLRALTVLTLFLTFDLVMFGAFTRLTDSGLGCPDWPGCYGSQSPLGAQAQIDAAQHTLPSGPVTQGKAWIEMVHRYLATGVGALIAVLAALSWLAARKRHVQVSPWWASATLLWVCLQGAFGALTVTMKLYPAIVTAHLLGGLVLLALLAVQGQLYQRAPLALPRGLHAAALALAVVGALQIALGGWVSTNYAVLACTDFPTCQGHWWPSMDFDHGFTLLRGLGAGKDGGYLPFAALTAIHYVHRLGAYVVLAAMAWFAWRLRATGDAALRRWSLAVAGVGLWQLASGLSNVVLGWPLIGAVAHTAGAAALVVLLAMLITRARLARPARVLRQKRNRALQAAP
ncbi:MAG: COX15/CtaA family protein [Burkholderiales bacterium]|nr:COX15/CtaA family protein [Burkholderiales bacterium]